MTRPEFCERCGCDVFECGGNITGRCIRPDVEAHSLPPRPKLSPLAVAIDVLVWCLCAAFAGAVALSYLMAVTP